MGSNQFKSEQQVTQEQEQEAQQKSQDEMLEFKQINLFDNTTPAEEVLLSKSIFGIDKDQIRFDLIKLRRDSEAINAMSGTKAVKGLSEVSGTGRKPWKQKGTGRARAGTRRRPQERGGARAHDVATVHNCQLPKKVRKLALKHAIAYKFASNAVIITNDNYNLEPGTKNLKQILDQNNINKCLIVHQTIPLELKRSSANLYKVNCLPAIGLNVNSILKHEHLILSTSSIEYLKEFFSK